MNWDKIIDEDRIGYAEEARRKEPEPETFPIPERMFMPQPPFTPTTPFIKRRI